METPSKFCKDWKFSRYQLLLPLLLKCLYALFLSWIKCLIELLLQGGSLSSHGIVSCGITLCNIFLILLLNKWTMSLTVIFWNDFSHRKPLIAFLIWSTFAFLKCHISRSYASEKTTLRLILAKHYFDTWFHHQIWLRSKNEIYAERPLSNNMGWFMNQLFQAELRRNTINSSAFINCFT